MSPLGNACETPTTNWVIPSCLELKLSTGKLAAVSDILGSGKLEEAIASLANASWVCLLAVNQGSSCTAILTASCKFKSGSCALTTFGTTAVRTPK